MRRLCVEIPPPQPEGVAVVEMEEGLYIDVDNALKLIRYLSASQRWMTDTWLACGPQGDSNGND